MSITQEVLGHHLGCFDDGDLDGIMTDYTEASVLVTPAGVLEGPDAIRGLMSGLFTEFAKPGASFTMQSQQIEGELAQIVWAAQTADNDYRFATDTFVVRGGKILYQTFAASVESRG